MRIQRGGCAMKTVWMRVGWMELSRVVIVRSITCGHCHGIGDWIEAAKISSLSNFR